MHYLCTPQHSTTCWLSCQQSTKPSCLCCTNRARPSHPAGSTLRHRRLRAAAQYLTAHPADTPSINKWSEHDADRRDVL